MISRIFGFIYLMLLAVSYASYIYVKVLDYKKGKFNKNDLLKQLPTLAFELAIIIFLPVIATIQVLEDELFND